MADQPSSLPRKILVAVEGSEPSLKESSMKAATYAMGIASVSKAELLGVCVVQIPDYIEEGTKSSLRSELLSKSETTLVEIGRLAGSRGIRYNHSSVETSGSISSAICALAEREGVDLIVLGTRADTSPLTKMMLGSVASGVAANARCPVLVVR